MSRPTPPRTPTVLGSSPRQPVNPSGTSGSAPRRSAGGLPGLARAASALRQGQPAAGSGSNGSSPLLSLPAHLRASTAPKVPSPLGRGTPNRARAGSGSGSTTAKPSLPVRTSKTTQKHVFLPEEPQTKPMPASAINATVTKPADMPPQSSSWQSEPLTTPVEEDRTDERSEAEKMSKSQREEAGLPRLTAYATADSYKMKLLQAFLKREHGVGVVRVFDDAVYAVYSLPLLPGYGASTKVRSSPAVKSPGGVSLLERMTEAEEVGYHDGFFPQVMEEGVQQTDFTHSNEYLLSSSPPQDSEQSNDSERPSRDLSPDVDKQFWTGHDIPGFEQRNASQDMEITRLSTSDPVETRLATDPDNVSLEDRSASGIKETVQKFAAQAHLAAERERAKRRRRRQSDSSSNRVAEVVFFEYGVTVFFGLSEREERDILEDCESAGVWTRPVADTDWEVEECHYVYDPDATYPRIYNDLFTFKSHSHLLKLSVSHAIAQSTKLSIYEVVMQDSLSSTASFPKELATTGELHLSRRDALKMTGRLFRLRMDVNLSSGILDTPELFWSEASLLPLYEAIRDYLEIGPRVQVLNDRLAVTGDLLGIIHDYIDQDKMHQITWIVIILIIIAVVVAFGEVTARIIFVAANRRRGELLVLKGAKNLLTLPLK
ncbi:hypothetical protein QFC22_002785 [Naganishia vaughanmartiniae]|uniref:Uncharacterized protein n=1 Tax=Naganishia vaughanmartiniae TaxID=1424756 RepID=A0ACC2XCQ2_9TREE|nr:hypothetical protein QFC22_002785 [Naganishia vaughanmartiniae]